MLLACFVNKLCVVQKLAGLCEKGGPRALRGALAPLGGGARSSKKKGLCPLHTALILCYSINGPPRKGARGPLGARGAPFFENARRLLQNMSSQQNTRRTRSGRPPNGARGPLRARGAPFFENARQLLQNMASPKNMRRTRARGPPFSKTPAGFCKTWLLNKTFEGQGRDGPLCGWGVD